MPTPVKVGQTVHTTKGSRYSGPFTAKVLAFGRSVWGRTAKVEKSDGRIVNVLLKNVEVGKARMAKKAPKKDKKAPKKEGK